MRYFLKLLTIFSLFCLTGCTEENEQVSFRNTYSSVQVEVERDYSEITDKKIHFADVFSIDKDSYYVYFYSRTCSHCQNLKNFIIEKGAERNDLYFVESSNEVTFVKDTQLTIGLDNIEGFGILGYPSLVKIEDKTITKNLAGNSYIKNELIN